MVKDVWAQARETGKTAVAAKTSISRMRKPALLKGALPLSMRNIAGHFSFWQCVNNLFPPAVQRHNRGFDAAFNTCLSAGPVQHEVLRNLEIVRILGGKVEDSKLEISLTQRDREFASKLLANVPATSTLVAVVIGGRQREPPMAAGNYGPEPESTLEAMSHQPAIIVETAKGRSLQA